MAKVTFSALLSAASGKIGDVVMSRWKGIAYARRRVIPSNPQSGDQCMQRHILKVSLLLWQSVKLWAKAPWDTAVSGYAWSGYNRFMDLCMAALLDQFTAGDAKEDPTWTTPAVTVLTPFNLKHAELIDVQAGSGASPAFKITWTARDPVVATDIVNPYYRLDEGTAWIPVTPVTEETAEATFPDCADAQEYEFALVPHDTLLDDMGLSSHQMGTPGA